MKCMRAKPLVFSMLASSCVVLLLAACGPGRYTPKPNEELFGTWTNMSYSGEVSERANLPQKQVIDGTGYHIFRFADDAAQYWTGNEQIVSRWTDSEGNIWYKAYRGGWNDGTKTLVPHTLYKLNKSATAMESVTAIRDTYTPGAFPNKIDPKDPSYLAYAREKKYGKLYLREYQTKGADEAAIIDLLAQYEAAFNSHDLQKFLSFFTKDAIYMPCGSGYMTFPAASQDSQDRITRNFGSFGFETYYDPVITVKGNKANVKLLVETGSYLADYAFTLRKGAEGWQISETAYAHDHLKE